jgi:glycosyltransferase involved in cell wall biosynthesis
MSDSRPLLFVTNHVPPDRKGAFKALHERERLELALFGGRSHHGTAAVNDPEVPHRYISQKDAYPLAMSGDYRAVIAGTAGRVALPAAWWGASRAKLPFVLWSALWAPVLSPAGLVGWPLVRHIFRSADAVVSYGTHSSDYAARIGAQRMFVAPQAVDGVFWGAGPNNHADAEGAAGDHAPFRACFIGRDDAVKGLAVAIRAWRETALAPSQAKLIVIGTDGQASPPNADGITFLGRQQPLAIRDVLNSCDALLVPSIRSRSFREPWGLVVNEAFHCGTAVIASDHVGAVAGGLVKDAANGLVVPAGNIHALAAAIRRLHDERELCAALGRQGRADVQPFTFAAWAAGFSRALEAVMTPCR